MRAYVEVPLVHWDIVSAQAWESVQAPCTKCNGPTRCNHSLNFSYGLPLIGHRPYFDCCIFLWPRDNPSVLLATASFYQVTYCMQQHGVPKVSGITQNNLGSLTLDSLQCPHYYSWQSLHTFVNLV